MGWGRATKAGKVLEREGGQSTGKKGGEGLNGGEQSGGVGTKGGEDANENTGTGKTPRRPGVVDKLWPEFSRVGHTFGRSLWDEDFRGPEESTHPHDQHGHKSKVCQKNKATQKWQSGWKPQSIARVPLGGRGKRRATIRCFHEERAQPQ